MCSVKTEVIDKKKLHAIIDVIRDRYISTSYYPFLVIGSGLSISYGVPGMYRLAERLNEKVVLYKSDVQAIWEECKHDIALFGLEAGLSNAKTLNKDFINFLRTETVQFINEKEDDIDVSPNRGFFKLLRYLVKSMPVNKGSLNIMTTNYDTIIEKNIDLLPIDDMVLVTGFKGELSKRDQSNILKSPFSLYKDQVKVVKLFKPHGSIDWVNISGCIYKIPKDSREYTISEVQIITPGLGKHEQANTSLIFSNHKQFFNEILDLSNQPLIIYGYGFNDLQFDNKIFDMIEKKDTNVLIISKTVKKEILMKAKLNHKFIIIFEDESVNKVIYKGEEFIVDSNLWDLDVLVEELI